MTTPIRRQYLRIKQRYPQAIVFFRMGDFYETFDEDAKVAARELEIALTSKPMGQGQRVPLAGIPYHAVDSYLARLVNRGYKVAICEQLSEPQKGKGLVQRDVVRVVTPGTVVEPNLLPSKANNYLAAVCVVDDAVGLAYCDITTSEFAVTQLPLERAYQELERLRPAEVVLEEGSVLAPRLATPIATLEGHLWEEERARQRLCEHFGVATLEPFGCHRLPLAQRAAAAVLHYLEQNQAAALSQITSLITYSTDGFMLLDSQTRRNLELLEAARPGSSSQSLLSTIDLTQTAMGGRLLRTWLSQPSLDLELLRQRQETVAGFLSHVAPRQRAAALLGQMADVERITNRIRGHTAGPRDLVALRRSLEAVPRLRGAVLEVGADQREAGLPPGSGGLVACEDIAELVASALVDDPPPTLGNGGAIRPGYSAELDSIVEASRRARQYLAELEQRERQRSGIKTLKVGYNKVFGYYLEVSNPNLPQVPQEYIRKQTLVNAERFFTAELKEHEATILNAGERLQELEGAIFRQVCQQIAQSAERLLGLAQAIARVDVLVAFAELAARYNYARPELNDGGEIVLRDGRHPVVERTLQDSAFVPNDTDLSNEERQLAIITGPNMSGKSTYLRQVALIVLLAQIGSFVPAASARIGLVDRIFTRIGAQDDLAAGQSTFMVEMVETAHILHQATPRSLIILDEIGRGTSTYDGLAIARAVAEFIHNHPRLGAKTLFATHYHELVELAAVLPRVINLNVAVAEEKGEVIFLRTIVPGGADKSYGVHVAQLAGLPRSVIHRAEELLVELEQGRPVLQSHHRDGGTSPPEADTQLSLFPPTPEVVEELRRLDVDSLTPLEAITKLYELQQKAQGSGTS